MLTVFSYLTVEIKKEDKIKALEIIKDNNVPFKGAKLSSSSNLIITFPLSKQKFVTEIFKRNAISANFSIKKALRSLFLKINTA